MKNLYILFALFYAFTPIRSEMLQFDKVTLPSGCIVYDIDYYDNGLMCGTLGMATTSSFDGQWKNDSEILANGEYYDASLYQIIFRTAIQVGDLKFAITEDYTTYIRDKYYSTWMSIPLKYAIHFAATAGKYYAMTDEEIFVNIGDKDGWYWQPIKQRAGCYENPDQRIGVANNGNLYFPNGNKVLILNATTSEFEEYEVAAEGVKLLNFAISSSGIFAFTESSGIYFSNDAMNWNKLKDFPRT